MVEYRSIKKRYCGGMAYTADLKSAGRKVVWVQLPPVAPERKDSMEEDLPNPKYNVVDYPFGKILARYYIEDPVGGNFWQYKMIKNGNNHYFFYSEEEVEEMERAVIA